MNAVPEPSLAADLPPRPDLAREGWVSLDGEWDFGFDECGTGLAEGRFRPDAAGFDQTIVVPYPWESRLSGVADTSGHAVGWYRRQFAAPEREAGQRVHLCFGAVDWSCRVWVNGLEVGGHAGGYTPFRLDITGALAARNTVVVRAFDETDPHLPTGKQIRWYTTTSGIWQPVWLELVAPTHVTCLAVDTRLDPPAARLTIGLHAAAAGPATVAAGLTGPPGSAVQQTVLLSEGANEVALELTVPGGRPWSPDSPVLYPCRVTVDQDGERDAVTSYVGLRTIATGPAPGQDHGAILLNGRPVYLRGALHQVFNPEGIYTYPDAAAMRRDMELARELGWNFLRLHIKLVDPRLLYFADRLGVMIMADLPNTWEYSPRARDAWEATLREAIPRDRQHPALIAWCLFNESWGLGMGELKQRPDIQAWVEAMWHLAKSLDPTRLIEDNSPCTHDHVVTDLNSWHFYLDDPDSAAKHVQTVIEQTHPGSGFNYCPGRVQGSEPLLNSEYSNLGARGGDRDVSWGFRYLTTLLRAEAKCQGYVYTEFCDLEWEHNGLLGYDRTPKEPGYEAFVPGLGWAELQGADFVGSLGPPVRRDLDTGRMMVETFISHYSALDGPAELRWRVVGWDRLAREVAALAGEPVPVDWRPAAVVRLPVEVPLPDDLAIGAVALELFCDGRRIAANYLNLLREGDLPAAETLDARTVALRFAPGDLAAFAGVPAAELPPDLERDKICATGRPAFTWRVRLPEPLRGRRYERVTLVVEAGARGGEARLDWPDRRTQWDMPQTKRGRTTPSAVQASLDGVLLGTAELADDWADARGVLSHLAGWHHGSHGTRVELSLDLAAHPALADRLAAGEPVELTLAVPAGAAAAHGLSIYGAGMGRYVLPPTLLLTAAEELPSGRWPEAEVTVDCLNTTRT